jgi:chemotaxis protein MotA
MDRATFIGLGVAFGAVLGGNAIEGGHLSSLAQPTAAIIVIGGTLGAVFVQFPGVDLKRAFADLKLAFNPKTRDVAGAVKAIVAMANKARREGLVAIEKDAAELSDPFMRRAFEMAVDGTEARALRSALEMEVTHLEEEGEVSPKVFEAMGGYAPTVGILGAVLGLIHVMQNLSDPSKLGSGIAVAFVATVYGVGTANILYLPLAGKLKARHHEQVVMLEVIVEGVCAVAEGENPRLIERKLSIYVHEREGGASRAEATAATARAAEG